MNFVYPLLSSGSTWVGMINEEVDQDKIQKTPVAMLTVMEDSDSGAHTQK